MADDPDFRGWPTCDGCGGRVAIADGVIALDTDAALARVRRFEERDQHRRDRKYRPGKPRLLPRPALIRLSEMPPLVEWFVGHGLCAPQAADYHIPWDEFRTISDLCEWSLHLSEKNWYEAAAWRKVSNRFFRISGSASASKPARLRKPVGIRFRVFQRDGFACVYCGAAPPDVRLEMDHVHPQSLGGETSMENCVTACWDCNHGKRDRVLPMSPLEGRR